MAAIGDAYVELPASGTVGPSNVFLRTGRVFTSASLNVISASTGSVLVASANPNRLHMSFLNDSPAICYIRYGGTPASSNQFSFFMPTIDLTSKQAQGFHEESEGAFTGDVYATWATATGSLKVTEFF